MKDRLVASELFDMLGLRLSGRGGKRGWLVKGPRGPQQATWLRPDSAESVMGHFVGIEFSLFSVILLCPIGLLLFPATILVMPFMVL